MATVGYIQPLQGALGIGEVTFEFAPWLIKQSAGESERDTFYGIFHAVPENAGREKSRISDAHRMKINQKMEI